MDRVRVLFVIVTLDSRLLSLRWCWTALEWSCRWASPTTPQTDGLTERVNHVVEDCLRCFVNHGQSNWDEVLPLCQFAINNFCQSSTFESPLFLNSGYHPLFFLIWRPRLLRMTSLAETSCAISAHTNGWKTKKRLWELRRMPWRRHKLGKHFILIVDAMTLNFKLEIKSWFMASFSWRLNQGTVLLISWDLVGTNHSKLLKW